MRLVIRGRVKSMSKLIRIFAVLAVTAVAAFSGAGTAKAATVPVSLQALVTSNVNACLAYKPCADYVRAALAAGEANPTCAGALDALKAQYPELVAIIAAFEAAA
jgi:hypothetical protein